VTSDSETLDPGGSSRSYPRTRMDGAHVQRFLILARCSLWR